MSKVLTVKYQHEPPYEWSREKAAEQAKERHRLMQAVDASGAELRHEAARRWGNSCPCCSQNMITKPPKKGEPTKPHYRTMGHNVARGHGGRHDQWIYICHRCNNEQGWMSFEHWGNVMSPDDPRKARVVEVGKFFRAHGEQS